MVNAVLVSCILLAAGLAARGSAGAAGFAAERQHALDQPVDISAAGAEIDDAHAQAVAAVERGRRQRDFSGGHQLCQIGRAQSELQSLMRISYAVFCLKKKIHTQSVSLEK